MTLKSTLITIAVRLLNNQQLWSDTCELVWYHWGIDTMSKQDKHESVRIDLKELYDDISTIVIDSVIELAVEYLKTKA